MIKLITWKLKSVQTTGGGLLNALHTWVRWEAGLIRYMIATLLLPGRVFESHEYFAHGEFRYAYMYQVERFIMLNSQGIKLCKFLEFLYFLGALTKPKIQSWCRTVLITSCRFYFLQDIWNDHKIQHIQREDFAVCYFPIGDLLWLIILKLMVKA